MKELCIMQPSHLYKTERFYGAERHEIFYGAYRNKSIKHGLVVFLTAEQHRGTYGVHGKYGKEYNEKLKKKGQKAYMKHYNKSKEEFIREFGKNYI